jgi:hypothetical protein
MSSEPLPPRPDAPHPREGDDRSLHVLVWVTIGVNALLGSLTLAGWFGRPEPCGAGCSWRPVGGMLWVLLAMVDIGLVLIWAGIGYLFLVRVGERIGRRISDRGRGERD